MEKEYILVQDNDSHWYVIPDQMELDWNKFCEISEDDERSWDVPNWAERVGGSPSLVKFTNYRIE
jgi:hypothetical protein